MTDQQKAQGRMQEWDKGFKRIKVTQKRSDTGNTECSLSGAEGKCLRISRITNTILLKVHTIEKTITGLRRLDEDNFMHFLPPLSNFKKLP